LVEPTVLVKYLESRVAVVRLLGEHCLADDWPYESMIDQLVSTHDLVVVDISRARYIDSSLIWALFRCSRNAAMWGSTLRLQMSREATERRRIEVCGALERFDVAVSREEAVTK
jgi:hypothetical protein